MGESASLIIELISLTIETYKAIRARVFFYSKEGTKTMSSLTTIEFVREGNQQLAYCMKDRDILFTKNQMELPGYSYRTEGEDSVEELLVDAIPVRFKKVETLNGGRTIEADNGVRYSRGDRVTSSIYVRSVNGFTKPEQSFSLSVDRWVKRGQLVVLFPSNEKPSDIRLVFRDRRDKPGTARHAGHETYALRRTTCRRWMFVWDFANPKLDRTYTVLWRWPK